MFREIVNEEEKWANGAKKTFTHTGAFTELYIDHRDQIAGFSKYVSNFLLWPDSGRFEEKLFFMNFFLILSSLL